MKAQKTELRSQLPQHGWSILEVIDNESEWTNLQWWEDEVWILESVWSPKISKIYLTFLVDPQAPIHGRRKDEGIWAVKASLKRLNDWKDEEGAMFLGLGKGWENELPAFLKGIDESRNKKEEEVGS